jgi:tetrahydromethanopterin S-methyltransferase subunit B
MAFKADWPDARYGFWVALGVMAAFAVIAFIKMLAGRVSGRHG